MKQVARIQSKTPGQGVPSVFVRCGRAVLAGEETGGEGCDKDDAERDGECHRDGIHAEIKGLGLTSADEMMHGDVKASTRNQRKL